MRGGGSGGGSSNIPNTAPLVVLTSSSILYLSLLSLHHLQNFTNLHAFHYHHPFILPGHSSNLFFHSCILFPFLSFSSLTSLPFSDSYTLTSLSLPPITVLVSSPFYTTITLYFFYQLFLQSFFYTVPP